MLFAKGALSHKSSRQKLLIRQQNNGNSLLSTPFFPTEPALPSTLRKNLLFVSLSQQIYGRQQSPLPRI
jgi:hypothetical protein